MGWIDTVVFGIYLMGIISFGLSVARYKKETSRDYFLAGDRLPWYAIGASLLASNISTEHFIGMIGWAYTYGWVIANFEWGAWYTWSVALWFFLPFYLRLKIYTMPEYLERRYSSASRYLLSATSIFTYTTALNGAVLYAGSKALYSFFGLDYWMGILILGAATGVYTVIGGLMSVVWVDTVQCLIFMVLGGMVTVLGLSHVGGLFKLMTYDPTKFHMFHLTHPQCPILAYYLCSFFVGAYYVSSNQFLMQRCLGARSHWDGRMGLLFSNFLKLLMPFIVVLPGIIAFQVLPQLKDPDTAYPELAKILLGPGLFGLMMAALSAAIMSTVSAAVNSAATLFTIDFYKELIRPNASEKELIRVGAFSAIVVSIIGIALGIFFAEKPYVNPLTGKEGPYPVFELIMNLFFFIGAPLSIVFLAGIFWRKATPKAAVWTIVGGYFAGLFCQYVIFTPFEKMPAALTVFLQSDLLRQWKITADHSWFVTHLNNFLWIAVLNGAISLTIMIVVSLLTEPKPADEVEPFIWKPSVMAVLSTTPGGKNGTRNLVFWWAVCILLTLSLYASLAVFQYRTRDAVPRNTPVLQSVIPGTGGKTP